MNMPENSFGLDIKDLKIIGKKLCRRGAERAPTIRCQDSWQGVNFLRFQGDGQGGGDFDEFVAAFAEAPAEGLGQGEEDFDADFLVMFQ